MKKNILTLSTIAVLILSSCSGNEETKNQEQSDSSASEEQTCFYTYSDGSATVSWTAYKTSAKVGVGGKFDTVNVKAGEKSTKITDVLKTIVVNIPTSSTNTNNENRDEVIIDSFFNKMANTDLILGNVKTAEGDNENGTCTFFLTINDVEQEVVLDYIVEDDIIKMNGEIDITNWKADDALASLNTECKDLHTGEDGVSKTWPNVTLEIQAKLNKDCH